MRFDLPVDLEAREEAHLELLAKRRSVLPNSYHFRLRCNGLRFNAVLSMRIHLDYIKVLVVVNLGSEEITFWGGISNSTFRWNLDYTVNASPMISSNTAHVFALSVQSITLYDWLEKLQEGCTEFGVDKLLLWHGVKFLVRR